MSAQLLDLAGNPMSWEALHEKVRAYWATHERDGEWKAPAPGIASGACVHRVHSRCSGFRVSDHKRVSCGCACHMEAE